MRDETGKQDTEFSILDMHGRTPSGSEPPAYFRDLNLETVLDHMADRWGGSCREYFRYLPQTREEEAYRRGIYGDVKKKAVFDALAIFSARMTDADELRRKKEAVPSPSLQYDVWQIRELRSRCDACVGLGKALDRAALSSEGMCRFRGILKDILEDAGFRRMHERVSAITEWIGTFRMVITYEKDRIRVTPGEAPGSYEALPEDGAARLQNPFAAALTLTETEKKCLQILERKDPAFFAELRNVSAEYGGQKIRVIRRFTKEIRFYLSYGALQKEMEEDGFSFTTPTTADNRPMEGRGLYDLALACVFRPSGKKVVPNDFRYGDEERFFILTGPNRGGKTTFARSLGQLVYFARIGLDVPAVSANVPFFRDIQTHFSVEESIESGRGKLKEELVRLSPMMKEEKKETFVVINELFTTAASGDALIMGRRVLEHFIRLRCRGIYVTHLEELAEACGGSVSLRAMRNGKGEPTFEILRGRPGDTACAGELVKQYRLTYEQLKERL